MKVKYLHTNIISKDWEKLADFYVKVFNCKKILPQRDLKGIELEKCTGVKDAAIKGIHLALPGFDNNPPTLEIFQYSENKHNYPPCPNREGFSHIAFYVDNLDKFISKILDNGGKKIGDIAILKAGNKIIEIIYMADIEGNIIELQTIIEGEQKMNKRDDFVDILKSQLDDWNDKIEKLEKKVQSANSSIRDKYKKEISSMKAKREELKEELNKAKNSSSEAFEELKTGLKETTDVLKETFDNIWNKFKS